ncbi:MAG: SEC-C domain-containing protein [Fimbriimonas ginsengisoli]|nr:SEC-C domain-containing protein [Fimbriimonas ginsengisoli]
MSYRRGGKERAAPPLPLDDTERLAAADDVRQLGGVYILGTERHESRRIDNQLRGRSGRQGDPGESRFYVSLEDMLWKIFNEKMLENPLLRAWPPMEEVDAKFLSRMIEKTQERIENHFFEARKHVLEYDDVLNAQREHVYGMRRDILLGQDVRPMLQENVKELIGEVVENAWMIDESDQRVFDYHVLFQDLNEVFPVVDHATVADLEKTPPGPELVEFCQGLAMKAYETKAEGLGDELMKLIETQVMLRAVNDHWMEHLQIVEYIREGIGLRGYGQVDPLVAYKRETYDAFQRTVREIRDQAVKMIFRAQVQREDVPQPMMQRMDATPTGNGKAPENVDWARVGRNDPCPCGSGKKFKSCHYPEMRAKGII